MRFILIALLLFSFPPALHALGADPTLDWHSADTAHFRINYADPQRKQAERVAAIAERAFTFLTRQLQWIPSGKIEIVLVDEFDISNGYSTPLPFNKSAIYLTPPTEGELLDNSLWLELLLIHELTHTIHLDKARAAPSILRHIFGRFPVLFPNLWEPIWAIEGIATYNESSPSDGKGRLEGPVFEAWMRIEAEQGFKSLAEINANGRALPTSKQYLYGVYFYEFLERKYGAEAIYKYINKYSGNIVPRVHTNPLLATGKHMDELWDEFIADLQQQVARRTSKLAATARADGDVIFPAHFAIDSLASVSDGVLAVVNDGLLHPQLLHIDAQGNARKLSKVKSGARIAVNADGTVLIAQPEICHNYNYFYDLYTWSAAAGMKRLTHCARYRRAVWLSDKIVALRTAGGLSTVQILEPQENEWRESRTLYTAPDQADVVDLTSSPDGKRVALIVKLASTWQILEFDSIGGSPRVLFEYAAPLHSLHYAHSGAALEFIAVKNNVYDLWRYQMDTAKLSRLSHTYTAVMSHSGIAQDGSVVLGVLAQGGIELRRIRNVTPLKQVIVPDPHASPLQTSTASFSSTLGEAENYHAWNSVYPRSWLPMAFADRGLLGAGAFTYGSDALGWHNYTANLLWETTQHEALGSLSYNYLGEHQFSISRNLLAQQWTGTNNDPTTTMYDRVTSAQWVSARRFLQIDRRIHLGLGAAMQTTERVQIAGLTTRPQDERVAAVFARRDTRSSNWYADGINRGNLSSLLYETYKPFQRNYDGHIVRFDTHGYLPLGQSVLSARWMEARAQGITEPFQLGGSADADLLAAPALNQRTPPLRGYVGSEAALRGQNARTASIEWRTPLADIDRHAMAPPIGINRLSASVFVDTGNVWNNGAAPAKYYRGMGIELHAEIKLAYQLALPLRVGIAQGLDLNSGNRLYLQLGQLF